MSGATVGWTRGRAKLVLVAALVALAISAASAALLIAAIGCDSETVDHAGAFCEPFSRPSPSPLANTVVGSAYLLPLLAIGFGTLAVLRRSPRLPWIPILLAAPALVYLVGILLTTGW